MRQGLAPQTSICPRDLARLAAIVVVCVAWASLVFQPGSEAPQVVAGSVAYQPVVANWLRICQLLTGTLILGYMIHSIMTRRTRMPVVDADPLTGLPGRRHFFNQLQQHLGGPDDNRDCAILMIDIDRFMAVNKRLGVTGADQMLCRIADRLKQSVDADAVAARLGGDDFAVLITNAGTTEAAEDVAQTILDALRRPIAHDSQTFRLDFSIGIALAPLHGQDAAVLLSRAELASFAAKQAGGNCHAVFDVETEKLYLESRALEREIIQACENGSFELYFQPLYCLKKLELRSFEALLRLPSSNGTMISPERFIPVAESLHRIEEIGEWVLRRACETALHWPDTISVAVNLSPLQFETGNLVQKVRETLDATGLDPSRLELEVTEGLMLKHSANIQVQLHDLRALGLKVVLDDFGSGYSSLSYLWQYEFDKIKIDKSFIKAMLEDKRALGILEAIIALGKSLDMPITAEGVETPRHVEVLQNLGCDLVQGFYFARPMPAKDVGATIMRAVEDIVVRKLPPETPVIKLAHSAAS